MSEAEVSLALRIERLSRFVERLNGIISDDIKVHLKTDVVIILSQSSYSQLPLLLVGLEEVTPLRILDQIQVLYADLKSEYWPQLGQARLEYRVVSTADGLELEFRLP